jgi:hypothetical protein
MARTREEAEARRKKKCRHFNGTMNGMCASKIVYPADIDVCFGQAEPECGGYNPLTADEYALKEAERVRFLNLLKQGLSSCCEAPIDTSQAITSGQHKDHGPRFCSKCKRMIFMV